MPDYEQRHSPLPEYEEGTARFLEVFRETFKSYTVLPGGRTAIRARLDVHED